MTIGNAPNLPPATLRPALPRHLAARRAAQHRDGVIQAVGAGLGIVCFLAAGFLLPTINQIRRDRQFVINPARLGTLPPDLALLGKLGTFRALAIDWASIRAERLQEDGKYYEAYQLHQTVCDLAPRFPSVWANAAWNMAYNISVAQFTPEARWQWVRNGITILRDQGIHYNPQAVALYKELSWIYWHKIGDYLDDHHLDYKRALAVEMELVLGPPPVTLTDQEYFDWFKKIVDAPRDLETLIENDKEVARLVFQLQSVALMPDDSLLDFVAKNIRPELQVRDLLKEKIKPDSRDARRLELITDPKNAKPLEKLLAAVRSRVLRERYKFDLDFMFELMQKYGPLDWRNAFSHSLYWSSVGDKVSQGHANLSIHDQINNARFILFGLQNLIVKGRTTLWPNFDDPFTSYIDLTPDTRYIPYLYNAYMKLGQKYFGKDKKFVEGTPGPNFIHGFVTAMHVWIQLLYLEGGKHNIDMAENLFAWLRKYNKHPDGSTQERYLTSLDEFVMSAITGQLLNYKSAEALVRSFLKRGLKQFSLGQSAQGLRSLVRARKSYEVWEKDLRNDIRERRKLHPFPLLVRDEVELFLTSPQIAPLYKASLWKNLRRLRPELCQLVYDRLRPYFVRLCEALTPPWDAQLAFPEPPNMAAYRAMQQRRSKKRPSDIGAEEGKRNKG